MTSEVIHSVDNLFVAASELKAPLALMRQLAFMLDTPDDFQFARSQIIQTSEQALRQVNDLTKIADLERGAFAIEPVCVRHVCNNVATELSHSGFAQTQHLKIHYSNRARLASANYELLFSIIYNFCTNAMCCTDEHYSTELSVRDHRGHIRVDIRDYGPAFPARLWREFRDATTIQPTRVAMRPGSSGLGLYIASCFSQYMRGNLGIIRHHDGASFYVELPVSHQASLF